MTRPPETEAPSLDRVSALSDGIFAIAITLLILPLTDAQIRDGHVTEDLLALQHQFFALVLSYVVIGRFWLLHHDDLKALLGASHRVLVTNLVFLFFVVLLPFPTALLGDGESAAATLVYALTIIGTSLSSLALWWSADHDGVVAGPAGRLRGRGKYYGTTAVVLGFLPSLVLVFTAPEWARFSWFLVFPFSVAADRLEARRRHDTGQ